MPTAPASAWKTFVSDPYQRPVRSAARTWKARSLGMKAVSATSPLVSRPTGLLGLAASTARTASVTMSKSYQLRSNRLPSAVSTAARLRVPVVGGTEAVVGAAAGDAAGAATAAGTASTPARAATTGTR